MTEVKLRTHHATQRLKEECGICPTDAHNKCQKDTELSIRTDVRKAIDDITKKKKKKKKKKNQP